MAPQSTSSSNYHWRAIGLWSAQSVVALLFIASGLTKLLLPMPELTAMMCWPGDYPAVFVRSLAVLDLAGGLGMILPSLTGVLPRLTVIAALCCVALQVLAIAFHVWRGEFAVLGLNLLLLPLCALVAWGRSKDGR